MSAGAEVLDRGDVLEVRLPSWLTADERQAIAAGVQRLIDSHGKLGAMGYAESVAAEVQRVMVADGLDVGHLQMFLGCTRARAAALWQGWKPFKLDELGMVADALGVPLLSLAAPGSDEGGQR
ncbi:hypothetical protein [Tessaracoccus sp. Z1128]